MSLSLYRKYRPQTFSDIIGQNHIVQTLSNAISHERVGHAYLFTGPRGTGKTTMARLFAKAVNCQNPEGAQPCMKCDICKNITEGKSLDIFEIDAASNTGVENIRELRETVKLPPSQAKYKVYIIDEVHMLSQGAFNALLKTLEEPPSHVIFILATTEIHKVPETIISRCQKFDFTRISIENIIKKLSAIAKQEEVEIEKGALELIAISAEGGMRDAESIMAQVISLEDKKVTTREVEEILGTTKYQAVEEFIEALVDGNTVGALKIIESVTNEGLDLEIFHKSLLSHMRRLLMLSVDKSLIDSFAFELTSEQAAKLLEVCKKTDTKNILRALNILSSLQGKIKTSFIPQLPLEIAAVKITKRIADEDVSNNQEPKKQSLPAPSLQKKNLSQDTSLQQSVKEMQITEEQKKSLHSDNAHSEIKNFGISDVNKIWREACDLIIQKNQSLAALLPHSMVSEATNGTITIITRYGFYKDKIMENTNRLTVEGVFGNLLGSKVKIKALTEEESGIKVTEKKSSVPAFGQKMNAPQSPQQSSANDDKKPSSLLADAAGILGGTIVE